jgi:hypothetical protein
MGGDAGTNWAALICDKKICDKNKSAISKVSALMNTNNRSLRCIFFPIVEVLVPQAKAGAMPLEREERRTPKFLREFALQVVSFKEGEPFCKRLTLRIQLSI